MKANPARSQKYLVFLILRKLCFPSICSFETLFYPAPYRVNMLFHILFIRWHGKVIKFLPNSLVLRNP